MKFFTLNLQIVIVLGFLLFCGFGCIRNQTNTQTTENIENKPDILTQKFADIDYRVKTKESETPTDWEKEQFQMLSKTVYKIKRNTELKGNWENVYPRFEVTEEVYENEETAEARNKRIEEKPPNLSGPRQMYWMVGGFRHGNKVYFVSTDGTVFYEMSECD